MERFAEQRLRNKAQLIILRILKAFRQFAHLKTDQHQKMSCDSGKAYDSIFNRYFAGHQVGPKDSGSQIFSSLGLMV
jgi:hypothetical protein